eukprot:CAMPEP_0169079072 /NCGR_PEP_ID=MMETSP1015-20121227/9749_1 /TAXON_ID=342587 /ORGANISM="Karlodinium micrum, Strain CCMP2283" /LENGTH=54 /DNA_ID=CAMNT_0009138703 /DNA_START=519 /DNA_END=683 /DNA_ORIENTATION=-
MYWIGAANALRHLGSLTSSTANVHATVLNDGRKDRRTNVALLPEDAANFVFHLF